MLRLASSAQSRSEIASDLSGVEYILDAGSKIMLDGSHGDGTFYFFEFNDGISMTLVESSFRKKKTFKVHTNFSSPLYLIYPLNENIEIAYNGSEIYENIPMYRPIVITSVQKEISVRFSNTASHTLLILKINRKLYASNKFGLLKDKSTLSKIFSDFKSDSTNAYNCSPNLVVGDLVTRLIKQNLIANFDPLILEAEVNLILAHILRQYVTDNSNTGSTSILSMKELAIIHNLIHKIMENPGKTYTINNLKASTGLNASKLQEGFRHIHNRTVTDFIKDVRLTHAAMLLKSNTYNVTEVMTMVGLSSNSYFTKIFKEKYKYTPKSYQRIARKSGAV